MSQTVLITGVTGYLGSWCAQKALEAGYDVVGTVRDPKSSKCAFLKEAMEGGSAKISSRAAAHLTLVKADLLSGEAAWNQVFEGRAIDYVLHTASPYFGKPPKDEMDYIRPAVEGTRSVMSAAIQHGVKRIVVTSSVAAVWFPLLHGKTYSAADWSRIDGDTAYGKSKTLAEQAAWHVIEGTATELTTVLPMFIIGPTLYNSSAPISGFESGELAIKIMTGKFPMVPNVRMGVSDVRDVASAHVLALQKPASAGKRLIVSTQTVWFPEILAMFSQAMPELKIRAKKLPTWLLSIVGLCNPDMKRRRDMADKDYSVDNSLVRETLDFQLMPAQETVAAMMEDLISLGAVAAPEKAQHRQSLR